MGVVIANRVVRIGLMKKVTFEQSHLDIGERAFQAEKKKNIQRPWGRSKPRY